MAAASGQGRGGLTACLDKPPCAIRGKTPALWTGASDRTLELRLPCLPGHSQPNTEPSTESSGTPAMSRSGMRCKARRGWPGTPAIREQDPGPDRLNPVQLCNCAPEEPGRSARMRKRVAGTAGFQHHRVVQPVGRIQTMDGQRTVTGTGCYMEADAQRFPGAVPGPGLALGIKGCDTRHRCRRVLSPQPGHPSVNQGMIGQFQSRQGMPLPCGWLQVRATMG